MKTIKTFEAFIFETSSEVELETNKLKQAKLVDLNKASELLIKKTEADKNKKQAAKEILKSNETKKIATNNAAIAKLQQREAQLMQAIAKEKTKM